MKNKGIVASFIFYALCFGCSEKDDYVCPYELIEWNEKTSTLRNENSKQVGFDISGKLEGLVKKLGKGELSTSFDTEFKKISDEVTNSTLTYDKQFVTNWNSLVTDICGKFVVINNKQLPDSLLRQLELSVFERVIRFYELTYPNKDVKKIIENKNKDNKELNSVTKQKDKETKLEISIQLPNESNGYKEVLINGRKANLSSNSTTQNPRVFVKSDKGSSQIIEIITNNGDTCILERVFDISNAKGFPIRFSPNCI